MLPGTKRLTLSLPYHNAVSTDEVFESTIEYWHNWLSQCTYKGPPLAHEYARFHRDSHVVLLYRSSTQAAGAKWFIAPRW